MKVWLAALLFSASLFGQVPQFRDGDTVVFLGDSITHSRKWHKYVMDYYLTHFPDRKLGYVNAGISGDTAAGALRRLDRDVLAYHPTVVVTMLGMNDVKRDLYAPGPPSEAVLAKRKAALDAYRGNMRKIALRLKESGVRDQILVISSPFDDTAAIETPNLPGVNAALQECGVYLRELAAEIHASVVDFNTPMTTLNVEKQKADPKFTLVGPDRVHPGDPGMLFMAYIFLTSQEVPAGLLEATITGNTKITAKALPVPVEKSARPALDWVPFDARFNAVKIRSAGLAPGKYEVQVDGVVAGSFDAVALEQGVPVVITATPQYKAAEAVAAKNELRRQAMGTLRDILKFEEMIPAPLTEEKIEAWLGKLRDSQSPQLGYYTGLAAKYKKAKPLEEATRAEIAALSKELAERNPEVVWNFQLARAGN